MRQRFEDKLGLTQQPRFVLSSSMKQVATPAAMSVGGDTSRFNLVGTSDWSLARLDGTVLGHGSVESFTSYSSSGSTVATQSTADDAANRLAVTLADLILARVILIQTETPQ